MTAKVTDSTIDGPYRGIHPFRYSDRQNFFGRKAPLEELFAKVLLYRLVVLFGDSGAGKSSLVNAGLIPALQQEAFGVERIRVRPIPDQPILVERIASSDDGSEFLPSIFSGEEAGSDASTENLPCSPDSFLAVVRDKSKDSRAVLVFDQFEELFTLFEPREGSDATEMQALQQRLLDAILEMATTATLRAKILICIREDYLGKLQVLATSYPQILDHRVRLSYLSSVEAEQAILCPFGRKKQRTNGSVEEWNPYAAQINKQLADRIVEDLIAVTPGSSASPTQVQIVCRRLWQAYASTKPEIGLDEYNSLDGVKGILEDFLKTELDAIKPPALRPIAVMVFANLVTLSGTRDVVNRDRLRGLVGDRASNEQFSETLEFLEGRRLINTTFERGTYFCEVASEYLIPPIQMEWQEFAVQQERVAAAKAQAEAAEEARKAKKFRRLVYALFCAAAIAISVAIYALVERNEAGKNAEIAELRQRDADAKARLARNKQKEAEANALLAQAKQKEAEAARAEAAGQRRTAESLREDGRNLRLAAQNKDQVIVAASAAADKAVKERDSALQKLQIEEANAKNAADTIAQLKEDEEKIRSDLHDLQQGNKVLEKRNQDLEGNIKDLEKQLLAAGSTGAANHSNAPSDPIPGNITHLPPHFGPEGLALLPSGMIILDENIQTAVNANLGYAGVWQAQLNGFVRLRGFMSERVIDVAAAQFNGQEVILVLMNNESLGGFLKMYSVAGKEMHSWSAPGRWPFTGFAVDKSNVIYLAYSPGDTLTSVIEELNLEGKSTLQYLIELHDTKAIDIGPIAVDVQRNRLLAADHANGVLYQVKLNPKPSTKKLDIEGGLVAPRALALDASGNRLFVAAGKHIWTIQLDENPLQKDDFASAQKFKSVSALAIEPNGKIWVADEDAGTIYLLSSDGQVMRSLSR